MPHRAGIEAMKIQERIDALDFETLEKDLDRQGFAKTTPLLDAKECDELIRLYKDEERFRSRIEMSRYRFGEGDYGYFSYPLPPLVQELRTHTYRKLAPIANRWMEKLKRDHRYPSSLQTYLKICHAEGQIRPTTLLLHYEEGGYNCLHQDLYGALQFPLQMTVFLNRPREDYEGGAFLLTEQRPRAQSRGEAVMPERGETIIFAVGDRPVMGKRGYSRVTMRHGVSTITQGARYALGVIFHDAR